MLIFLHTSPLHIPRFNNVLKRVNFKGEVKHIVNESLLDFSSKNGKVDEVGFENQIKEIKKDTGFDKVMCTCSTYGKLVEKYDDVYRIDEAIANYIVANYSKIGIAYAVKSTLNVSVDLLQSIAMDLNKEIVIEPIDCTSSWSFFERSDISGYSQSISEMVLKSIDDVEVVFLAQVSMDGVEDICSNQSEKEILSSTYLGVKIFLKR